MHKTKVIHVKLREDDNDKELGYKQKVRSTFKECTSALKEGYDDVALEVIAADEQVKPNTFESEFAEYVVKGESRMLKQKIENSAIFTTMFGMLSATFGQYSSLQDLGMKTLAWGCFGALFGYFGITYIAEYVGKKILDTDIYASKKINLLHHERAE